jgi:tetratricopeptide (TPR) repeat protein
MERRWLALALSVVVLLQGGSSIADDSIARARAHFEIGQGHFKLGAWAEALKEFNAGYALAPKPRFLLNAGLCYQRLGRLREARDTYARYLAEAPKDEDLEQRQQVERLLQTLDARIAAEPPPPPPVEEAKREPAEVKPAVSEPAPEVKPAIVEPTPAPRKSRAWLWATLGVTGVVAVGLGLGLGLGLAPAADAFQPTLPDVGPGMRSGLGASF